MASRQFHAQKHIHCRCIASQIYTASSLPHFIGWMTHTMIIMVSSTHILGSSITLRIVIIASTHIFISSTFKILISSTFIFASSITLRLFNGQQGSEDQDVWNHLFKEGVCEEVLPFIKIGPSRSGKWMMNDEWFHMKVLISYKTNGKPALYHFIFSKWILNQVSLFCHAPQKIDDVNVSKVSTSHQFFFCQKVDIEFCQSFAKFGNVSIQEISYFGFYGGGWISLPLPRKQQKAQYR